MALKDANLKAMLMNAEKPMLILEDGLEETSHWFLDSELTRLGRWPDNDVILPDRRVSRYHAEIRRVGATLLLQDRGSTNGTFVNGARIAEPYTLAHGDRIQIAPRFQLRFVDQNATAHVEPVLHDSPRIRLDAQERRVRLGNRQVELSPAQYRLLDLLSSNEDRVVSRGEIVREVWPAQDPSGITNEAIDALVRRLRDRLAQLDPGYMHVQTVRGHGFKFENR
jgi:pSer/pThr/pTyr-binding forkhead associated (FHA) protein